MNVEINMVGVLLASLAAMVVGSVWYAKPVFGKSWIKLLNLDEKRMKKDAPKAMASAVLMSLLTAFVLAHVTYLSNAFYGGSFMSSAVTTAFWMWLGFQFTLVVMNGFFEQRPVKLMFINASNQLVTLLAMGLVLGAVGV